MRSRSLLLLPLFLLSAVSMASDAKVEELLAKMRDAYKAVKSARLEVEMVGYGEEEQKLEASAKVLYSGPKDARVEFTPKNVQSDEPVVAFYIQDGKKMGVGPAADKLTSRPYDEEEFPFILMNLETLSFWQWDKQLNTAEGKNMNGSDLKIVEDVEWEGKKWLTLEESVEKNDIFVRYFIDPKTHFIWRCQVKELESMKPRFDSWLTKLDTDIEVDKDQFKID